MLRRALVEQLDYLVKPIATMRRKLFDSSNSHEVTVTEIESKLDPFSDLLPYANDVLIQCKQNDITSLGSDEYGQLSMDVLQNAQADNPLQSVLNDYQSVFKFLSEIRGEEVGQVNGEMVQEFLADRNLWGFRRAVDVEIKLGKEFFKLADLELTLKRYLSLKDELSSVSHIEAEEPETMPAVDPKSETEKGSVNIEEEEVGDKGETVVDELDKSESFEKEWEEFKAQAKSSETEIVEGEPLLEIQTEKPDEKGYQDWGLDDMLEGEGLSDEIIGEEESQEPETEIEKSTEVPEVPEAEAPLTGMDEPVKMDETTTTPKAFNVSEMIDKKTEKAFIKKLFSGNKEEYAGLLSKLDDAESWRVAKILIDNELFKRDIDPFSREAIKMVDLVYSSYYPEEGAGGDQ
jgi:hypothetical protein